ncbi:hypothetical protein COOONC_05552 [Cooperia oncophora]
MPDSAHTSSACKAGDVVYLNPNSQTPISCNDEIQNNCPKNFQLQAKSLKPVRDDSVNPGT